MAIHDVFDPPTGPPPTPPTDGPGTRPVPDAADADGPGQTITPDQAVLVRVWARLLGMERVGVDDDFFVLGGDSMMAIRAIVEAESEGVSVSLTDLFEHPTIRQLTSGESSAARAAEAVAPADLVPPADLARLPAGVERAYPASFLQQGLIFETMAQDESMYHDVVSRRITLPFDERAMRRALDAVADRHEALRTSINLTDYSVVLQLVSRLVTIPLRTTDGRAGDLTGALRADRAYAGEPFDLERGPLLRIAVTVVADDAFQLTYGFPHAVMDGWSENVFVDELMSCYTAYRRDAEPEAGGRTPDMVDFIRHELAAVDSPATREFWLSRATGLPAVAEAPARGSGRHHVSVPVPAGTRQRITDLSATLQVPLKSILLAAHLAARHAQQGGRLPVTGLVANGRLEEAGGDRMIGLFLNVLPFAVPARADSEEFVRAVLQAERELFPHRRFPYAEIKRLVGRPLFDVTFNYVRFRLEHELHSAGWLHEGSLEIYDKVSFPLIVDAVLDPDGDRLRLDFSADSAVWSRPELENIADLHRTALERIAARRPLP